MSISAFLYVSQLYSVSFFCFSHPGLSYERSAYRILWFDYPDNTGRKVQMMEVILTKFSPFRFSILNVYFLFPLF
jgi:hypothetical protein